LDLRGMSSEDVQNLMGHLINYKQVLGNQANSQEGHAITEAQNLIENYYKDLKNRRETEEFESKKSKLNRSAPFEVDGKMYIDWTDAQGNPVEREEVGKATRSNQAERVFKLPNGQMDFIGPDEAIPPGAVLASPSEGGGELTEAQKFSQAGKLAEIDASMVAQDVENPDMLDGYAEIYNQQHPTHQWIKVPGTDGIFGSDAKWTKLPKDPTEIVKMPKDTLVGRSPSGKKVTLGMIVEMAQAKGISPEQALKELGLAR